MSDNVAHAVAGAAGGIVSTLATYPLITVSSRMQVQKDSKDAYKSFADGVSKIIKSEGIPGLYSGCSSALFGIAITNGVYYGAYERTKDVFLKASGRRVMSTLESMIAGAIAGSLTVLATNPIWVVNTRMTVKKDNLDEGASGAVKPKKPANAWDTFLQIIREDGPGALWQGLAPALILVINPIIQYTVFEQTRGMLEKYRRTAAGGKSVTLAAFDIFILGAIAKLAATSITYPYIVVKSRMQLRQSKSDESARYTSIMDGFRKILKQEGVKGLYKGIETKIVQSVLTAALLFTAKEELFKLAVFILTIVGARESKAVKSA
ncbi:mitochondrial carrier domain-containing protein [Catenaria anguillulae PL171]|uniref:Mitochondrial carrier domain-containing protein n=1 Tax=Catenaria anguillulae PL171 TaxID=765915 RepID=A0A1Y2H9J2_9FUNG|nr:mitochondrial carrier domain-containing protein [Catenaria anguillulae PL171]ORZ39105.1 mitochondrial carrier domain-containing protein [Catenaria anguillulae PL171]